MVSNLSFQVLQWSISKMSVKLHHKQSSFHWALDGNKAASAPTEPEASRFGESWSIRCQTQNRPVSLACIAWLFGCFVYCVIVQNVDKLMIWHIIWCGLHSFSSLIITTSPSCPFWVFRLTKPERTSCQTCRARAYKSRGALLLSKLKCACSNFVPRSSIVFGCIGKMTMGTTTTRVLASDLILEQPVVDMANVWSLPKPHSNPHPSPSPKRRCSPLQGNPTCRITRIRTNTICKMEVDIFKRAFKGFRWVSEFLVDSYCFRELWKKCRYMRQWILRCQKFDLLITLVYCKCAAVKWASKDLRRRGRKRDMADKEGTCANKGV